MTILPWMGPGSRRASVRSLLALRMGAPLLFKPHRDPACPVAVGWVGLGLDYCDVRRRRSLWTVFDVKRNPIAFIQRLEPRCVDPRVMNEHIRSVFLLDKAIAFTVVKPLYGTFCHDDPPVLWTHLMRVAVEPIILLFSGYQNHRICQ